MKLNSKFKLRNICSWHKISMDLKRIILTFTFCFLFVKCIIPSLSVRKLDDKLIERKRQDTLEICRIFNEENKVNLITDNTNNTKYKRTKRDVDNNEISNPSLKHDGTVKVEKIVDKLYDDLDPSGNTVNYRRRNLTNITKTKNKTENTYRRFNFAPAQLFGPLPSGEEEITKPLNSPSVQIPWIKKWRHGIVPFFIDPNTYDSFLAETILKAFDYIEKATCIRLQRLRERPTDKQSMQSVEWLYITNPSGIRQCVHTNERKPNTGVQMVVFGYDCLSQGEIAHEVMHVLGFSHEHTRPDRDRYITILYENIKPGYKKYFEVRREDPLSSLPYDYASVLHYPPRAFSKNGQVTIYTESGTKIGQRDAFSEQDVEKIGMIYGLECVERNKDYLRKTCPSVGKVSTEAKEVPEEFIDDYFKDRVWPYGIINYKIKDALEFTAEERENIKAVLYHIEKETCIEFRDITEEDKRDTKNENESLENINESPESTPLPIVDNRTEETFPDNANITSPAENVTLIPDEYKLKTIISNLSLIEQISNERDNNNNENTIKVLRHGKAKKLPKKAQVRSKTKEVKKLRKEKVKEGSKKIRIPISPHRRHAVNVIVLKRSSEPGCKCPPPGRPNGDKVLTIHSDCFNSVNDLLHVFVHVLGLDHQHNMHDRDTYLHILWDNLSQEIKKEMEEKLPPAASAGFAYDYQSVMHYPWLQIKDGVTNIMYPIWNDGWAMGHWQGLSWTDVQKLDVIYKEQCEKRRREMRNE
ncbi:uncharacterized protein LOC126775428 [Nymphalis io]|uniref:uncharacterized protein LOC126775428 n=1 Tax=Inachis io TaxID=171585 RepID=UPI0021698BB9|nr:uncharacterized protein LOC126775428 [Nymphalis io]